MGIREVMTPDQKKAARYAKALGHPIRMYILELLSKQSCCYSGDLCEVLPVVKSTLSQHLKELKKAGLIQGETEPPKIFSTYFCNNLTYQIKVISNNDRPKANTFAFKRFDFANICFA
jgi:predicted transcriptional regulator